jgi:lipocalin
MTTKTLLLCLALFMAATAQVINIDFQPVSKFDSRKLIGTKWYEAFYADHEVGLLDACTRYVFTRTSDNQIIYQYGYFEPGLEGELLTSTLTIKQSGKTGAFTVTTPNRTGQFFILDYARDYSWIVIGDTSTDDGGFLSVLSEDPLNLTGLQRALELAQKYGQDAQQASKCPYRNIFYSFAKARELI